MMFNQR